MAENRMSDTDEVLGIILREADRMGIPDEEAANLFMEGFFDDIFSMFGYEKKTQPQSQTAKPAMSDEDREKAFQDLIKGYDTNPDAALYYKQILKQAAQHGGVFALPAVDYTENELKEMEAYLAHRGWEKTSIPSANGGVTTAFKAPEKELALVGGTTTPPQPEQVKKKAPVQTPGQPESDYSKMSPEQKKAYEKMLIGNASPMPPLTPPPPLAPEPATLSVSSMSEPQMVVYDKALSSITQRKMPYYIPMDADSEVAAQILPKLGWKTETISSPGERGQKGKGKAVYAPPKQADVKAEAKRVANALRLLKDVYYPTGEELHLAHII